MGVRLGVASVVVPVLAGVAVTAEDALRKRRRDTVNVAPDNPPRPAEVETNHLTTYTYGEHLYEAMLRDIDAATRHVYLASYIWKGDEVGQRFKDAVIAAADRGVRVHLVYDGFANLVVPPSFLRFPPHVQVMRFPMVRAGWLLVDLRRTGRDHRKILVVDGRVGYVGGYNIGSVYATQWRDTHLRIEGEAVWELENAFVDFWNRHRRRGRDELPDTGSTVWNSRILAARNEPSRLVFPVRGLYLDAVDRATDHIWITQGYFIPDREILRGLLAAAARGVDVRVVMPAKSNHVVADWVARGYFTRLLEGGVHIHLYEHAMVHAKTATVDGVWTTVGTANIDRLSLIGNYEINVQVHDPQQAAQMEEIFREDLANCREMTLEAWSRRSLARRVTERLLAPLEPMM